LLKNTKKVNTPRLDTSGEKELCVLTHVVEDQAELGGNIDIVNGSGPSDEVHFQTAKKNLIKMRN
jgi:hypothetical protein